MVRGGWVGSLPPGCTQKRGQAATRYRRDAGRPARHKWPFSCRAGVGGRQSAAAHRGCVERVRAGKALTRCWRHTAGGGTGEGRVRRVFLVAAVGRPGSRCKAGCCSSQPGLTRSWHTVSRHAQLGDTCRCATGSSQARRCRPKTGHTTQAGPARAHQLVVVGGRGVSQVVVQVLKGALAGHNALHKHKAGAREASGQVCWRYHCMQRRRQLHSSPQPRRLHAAPTARCVPPCAPCAATCFACPYRSGSDAHTHLEEEAQHADHGEAAVLDLLDLQLREGVGVVSQAQGVKGLTCRRGGGGAGNGRQA